MVPGRTGVGPGTAEVPLSALERFRTIPAVAKSVIIGTNWTSRDWYWW